MNDEHKYMITMKISEVHTGSLLATDVKKKSINTAVNPTCAKKWHQGFGK